MFRNKPKSRPLLLVSEMKLDDSMAQFLIISFWKSYRLDRCSNGGGLLLYIRDDIPSHLLTKYKPPKNVECLFVERRWASSLVVSDLRSEFKGSRLEPGCQLCAEVSSQQ